MLFSFILVRFCMLFISPIKFYKSVLFRSKVLLAVGSIDFETCLVGGLRYIISVGVSFGGYRQWYLTSRTNVIGLFRSTLFNCTAILLKKFLWFVSQYTNEKYNVLFYFHGLGSENKGGALFLDFLIKNFNTIFVKRYVRVIVRLGVIYQFRVGGVLFRCSLVLFSKNLPKLFASLVGLNSSFFRNSNFLLLISLCGGSFFFNHLRFNVKSLFEVIRIFRLYMYFSFGFDLVTFLSLSSVSFCVYRKYFLDSKFLISCSKGVLINFFNSSYFGGISEVFSPKGWDLYFFDVNALYPFVMQNECMPVGYPLWINPLGVNLSSFFGFLDLVIIVPKFLRAGVLFTRFNSVTILSTGLVRGVFFSEEIKFAVSLGCKVEKINFACSFRRRNVFDGFVGYLYFERLFSRFYKNNSLEFFFKLILNSLHGRFSIRSNKPIDFINFSTQSTLGLIVSSVSTHISSAIAAYARIFIVNCIYLLLSQGVNSYYCDTDSLVVDNILLLNMVSRNKLGFFKLLVSGMNAVFVDSKLYFIEYGSGYRVLKIRGLLRESVSGNFSRLDFERLFFSGSQSFHVYYNRFMLCGSGFQPLFLKNSFFKRSRIWLSGFWVNTFSFGACFY